MFLFGPPTLYPHPQTQDSLVLVSWNGQILPNVFLQPEQEHAAPQCCVSHSADLQGCACVCVFHVDSASSACRRSISFPPSLERPGLHNLLVSQAHLAIESGQRLDRGELQPGLRAEGRSVLMWRSGGGVGRAWRCRGCCQRRLAPTDETREPAGKPKGWHSVHWADSHLE